MDGMEATAIILTDREGQQYKFIAVYNPPNFTPSNRDLGTLFNSTIPTLALGDFNAKSISWNCRITNRNGKALKAFADANNIHVLAPPTPTYYPTRNCRPDVLDIAVVQHINHQPGMVTVDELDSDHIPVVFTLYGTTVQTQIPALKRTDWDGFRTTLNSKITAVVPLNSKATIDNSIDQFTAHLTSSRDCNTTSVQRPTFSLPPEAKKIISIKNKLRKIAQSTRHPNDITNYNRAQREVKLKLREIRQEAWDSKVMSLATEDSSIWQMAKALKGQPNKVGPIHSPAGLVYSDEEIAEAMADSLELQFMPNESGSNSQIERIERKAAKVVNSPNSPIKPTSPTEVKKIIAKLKVRKACGGDGVTNRLIKELSFKSIILLVNILNACLRLNYFPTKWKQAIVINFKKPGKDPLFCSNYRPISLLPCLSKILEKVILNRLQPHLDENAVLSPTQFGFRKQHATTHQIARVIENLAEAFNNKQMGVGCFLDIEKAFDKVWTAGLIQKLVDNCIPAGITKIVASFLRRRSFQVRVKSALSSARQIHAGVPQGSLLGPTLFNIYINDMPSPEGVQMGKFADDTAVVSRSRKEWLAFRKLQGAITEVFNWCRRWRIKINASKSSIVQFKRGRSRISKAFQIKLGNTILPEVSSVKYLGVYLDQHLTFEEHINRALDKANAAKAQLYSLLGRNSKMSLRSKCLLYKTVIRPILLYASPAWGCCSEKHRRKIQVFQSRTLRQMAGAPFFIRNSQLHRDLRMDEINHVIRIQTEKFYDRADASAFPLIQQLGGYDPTVEQSFKRPRTICHDLRFLQSML